MAHADDVIRSTKRSLDRLALRSNYDYPGRSLAPVR
jgi:hypothetical protein